MIEPKFRNVPEALGVMFLILAVGLNAALWSADQAAPIAASAPPPAVAATKVAVDQLPAAVKDGFNQEVKGGAITSVKKLGSDDQLRYQIHYKVDGKEHQLTLGTDGKPTRKRKS